MPEHIAILQLSWTLEAWSDYAFWLEQDKKILKKINGLLKDCQRSPFAGIGKPEPLKGNLAGFWSRRITDEHRLVYCVERERLVVISCRYHYQK